ncbi:hypothetical protein [Luteimonas sp. SDU101]|uniref:hypothetical protein n=1 Tax=Luteimonas sp. SDU101 TaxID=3422593 RepID=UPI003EBAC964
MDMGKLIIVPSGQQGFKCGKYIVKHEYGTSHFVLFSSLEAAQEYVSSKSEPLANQTN